MQYVVWVIVVAKQALWLDQLLAMVRVAQNAALSHLCCAANC
jgi:hypothetical protein